jgi:hypothetical protein
MFHIVSVGAVCCLSTASHFYLRWLMFGCTQLSVSDYISPICLTVKQLSVEHKTLLTRSSVFEANRWNFSPPFRWLGIRTIRALRNFCGARNAKPKMHSMEMITRERSAGAMPAQFIGMRLLRWRTCLPLFHPSETSNRPRTARARPRREKMR